MATDKTMLDPAARRKPREAPPKRKGGAARAVVIAVVLLAILAVPVAAVLLLSKSRSTLTIEVPGLKGMTADQARRTLTSKGLKLGRIDQVGDLMIPPGRIVAQQLKAGTKAKPGTSVGVSVSKGPFVFVPDVAGLKPEEAVKALAEAKLMAGGHETAQSKEVEAGLVLGTKPEDGAEVQAGSKVLLVVSTGAMALSAGAAMGAGFQKPKSSLSKITVTDVGQDSFTLKALIALSNPNPVEILVERLTYSVSAEGVPLGKGKSSPNKTVPAGGSAQFTIGLTVPFSKVPPVGPLLLEKGNAKYYVGGHAAVSAQGMALTVPLHISGRYKLPQMEQMIRLLRLSGKI